MIGRRGFIQVVSAFTGLTLAFELGGCARPAPPKAPARSDEEFAPNAFVRVAPSGKVTLQAIRLEMGQGVLTLLPAMLAEELEVDLADVRLETPIPSQKMRLHTSGSDSSRDTFVQLRTAGAAAREMLVEAAAATWGVDARSCVADRGRVLNAKTGAALTYDALVAKARTLPVPEHPALKPRAAWKTIGRPIKRVNGKDIVRGAARYGADVRVPGMLFAAIARAPTMGATAVGFDATKALAVPGVAAVHPVKAGIHEGVAVLARDTWTALRARGELEVRWSRSPLEAFDSEAFLRDLPKALDGPKIAVRHEGDARAALAAAKSRFSATYVYPFQAHAPLEAMNCTAHVKDGEVLVWAPTQTDVRTIEVAAKVGGVPKERVTLHATLMGGGFGRRLFADFVGEAVELSRAARAPVQVVWSRDDDLRFGYFQPATAERFTAGLDAKGRIGCLVHDTTSSALTIYEIHGGTKIWPEAPKRPPRDYAGDQSPWGAYDNPYEFPSLAVDCADVTSPVPTGPWRAVEYPSTVFARESFLDELARRAGVDPFAYRLELLPPGTKKIGPYAIDRVRMRKVLELAREKSGWDAPLAAPEGWRAGRGLAANVYSGQSYIAMVLEVLVANDLSAIRATRAVTVVDCGAALNPLGIEGQTESGIAWGLSAALLGKADFVHGQAVKKTYAEFEVLRIDQMPRVETFIVASDERPGGYGEHPVPLAPPALANAVFAASGKRVRQLPITPASLRGA